MLGVNGAGGRVNRILENEEYRKYLAFNEAAERDREFCRHDMGHFLDVARIAVILNLKEGLAVEEELIYAAALLHDIGRHVQYADGTPHEAASAELAEPILAACGFGQEERLLVREAILAHRSKAHVYMDTDMRAALHSEKIRLCGLLYRADKMSRSCFACKAELKCDWEREKKNLGLVW